MRQEELYGKKPVLKLSVTGQSSPHNVNSLDFICSIFPRPLLKRGCPEKGTREALFSLVEGIVWLGGKFCGVLIPFKPQFHIHHWENW